MFQRFCTLRTWTKDVYHDEVLITFNCNFRTNRTETRTERRAETQIKVELIFYRTDSKIDRRALWEPDSITFIQC